MDIKRHKRIFGRMAKAVSKRQVAQLTKDARRYTGTPGLLEQWLDTFGSDNPYEACENAHLKRVFIKRRSDGKSPGHLGTSRSGHKLKNQQFLLANRRDSGKTWTTGADPVIHIFEIFGTKEQKSPLTSEGRKKIQRKKKEQLHDDYEHIRESLDEIIDDPEKIKIINSTLIKERIKTIKYLDDQVKARMQLLDKIVHGNTAFLDNYVEGDIDLPLPSVDKGGGLLGWFKREFDNLPQEIRDYFTTYVSPHKQISEDERKEIIGTLIAYAARHRKVRRDAIIGGYQEDLELIVNLPEDHNILKQHGRPVMATLKTVLSADYITLIDAATIFEAYPLDEIRITQNGQHFAQCNVRNGRITGKGDIANIMQRFKKLFMEDDLWKEDSYGISVPKRLNKSVYFGALQNEDFRAIRDMLRLATLAPDKKRFLQSTSMKEFKQLTDRVVLVARKVKHLDYLLDKKGVTYDNDEDAKDVADKIKKETFRGKDYDLVENFEAERGISYEEFLRRGEKVLSKDWIDNAHAIWNKHAYAMKEGAQFGIAFTGERVEKLIEKAKALTADIGNAFERIEAAKASPLFSGGIYVSEKEYYTPQDREELNHILEACAAIKQQEESFEEWNKLKEKYDAFTDAGKKFYRGSFGGHVEIRAEYFTTTQVSQLQHGRVTFMTPESLEEHVNAYVHTENLPEDWLDKVKFLVTRTAGLLIKKTRRSCPKTYTIKDVSALIPSTNAYFHQNLIDDVETVYQELVDTTKPKMSVVRQGQKLLQGSLHASYRVVVRGTSTRDKDKFNPAFRSYGFRYDGKQRRWHTTASVAQIGLITQDLVTYNQEHGRKLRIEVIE